MSDDDKPGLPYGADTLLPLGPCGDSGREHVVAMAEGRPVAMTHFQRVEEGKPLPADADLYWVDSRTGKVVDSMRVGNGPARVSTPAYREGWDAIFGNKERGQA